MRRIFANPDVTGGGGWASGGTYWVQQDREEELASLDALVQLLGSPGVLLVEDGVGEQPAGLPGEDLWGERGQGVTQRQGQAPSAHHVPTALPWC